MPLVIWLIGVWLSGLIQFLVVPLHLIILGVIGLIEWQEPKNLFWLVFLAGLVNDLFLGIGWGLSSLLFLFLSLGLIFLRRRYSTSPWLMGGVVFLFEVGYARLIFHRWQLVAAGMVGLMVVGWFFLLPLVSKRQSLKIRV